MRRLSFIGIACAAALAAITPAMATTAIGDYSGGSGYHAASVSDYSKSDQAIAGIGNLGRDASVAASSVGNLDDPGRRASMVIYLDRDQAPVGAMLTKTLSIDTARVTSQVGRGDSLTGAFAGYDTMLNNTSAAGATEHIGQLQAT